MKAYTRSPQSENPFDHLTFHLLFMLLCSSNVADLRDDKQFFVDHPGAVPITTAQVYITILSNSFCLLKGNSLNHSPTLRNQRERNY